MSDIALNTGASGAPTIKAINRQSIHRICSGQVILDLATAIKELVENALDAGATNIEVRLREYGSALVEVADNGRGVPPADYQALTLKYHTSKISSFDDLSSVSTYGFRGEALSSLCAVSELSVITRTAEQDAGVRLEYDHEGVLTSRTPAPRAVGTTVTIKDLFKTLPVRHKEFLRNLKREFARAVSVLQAYALIATHARLLVTNQPGGKGGQRTTVLTTAAPAAAYDAYASAAASASAGGGGAGASAAAAAAAPGSLPAVLAALAAAPKAPPPPDADGDGGAAADANGAAAADPRVAGQLAALRDNVVSVFGARVAEALEPLVLPEDPETGVRVVGWVSRAGCGLRGDSSRQFFFLNGRPVDLPKAARVLNDAFKSLSSPAHAASYRPMALLSVCLAAADVDVNVTPDKRRVFMAAEDRLCGLLQKALQALWEPSRCTFVVNTPLAAGGGPVVAGGGSSLVAGPSHLRGGRGLPAPPQRQSKLNVQRGGGASTAVPATTAFIDGGAGDADAAGQGHQEDQGLGSARGGDEGGGGGSGMSSQRPTKRPRLSSETGAAVGDGGFGADAERDVDADGDDGHRPSNVLEPSPRALDASAAAAASGGGATASGLRTVSVRPAATGGSGGTAAPFRHPFLSMFAGFAAGGKGRHAAGCAAATAAAEPAAAPSRTRAADGGSGPRVRSGGCSSTQGGIERTVEGAEDDEQSMDREEPGVIAAVDSEGYDHEGDEAGRSGVAAASDAAGAEAPERGSAPEAMDVEGAAAATAAAEAAGQGGELWTGAGSDRGLIAAGADVEERRTGMEFEVQGEDAGPGTEAATVAEAETEVEAAAELDTGRAARAHPAASTAAQPPPSAAGASPTQQPAAVLRLEPGQLAALTAARVRHLAAQRRRRQQEEEQAMRGAAAAAGVGAEERRFNSSSLQQEDAPGTAAGGGGVVSEDGGAAAGGGGGGGTRAEREAAAERELERVFRKQQFREMRVIGQFNLGFILASHGRDVFIVDQHAAAEKTTFERLQRTVTLSRQPLLAPMPLSSMLPVDQELIREHLDVFRRNGFDFVERSPDGKLVPLRGGRGAAAAAGAAAPAAAAVSAGSVQAGGDGASLAEGDDDDVVLLDQENEKPLPEDKAADDGDGGGLYDGAYGSGAGGGGELLLSAVPVSRATGQLGLDDVAELVAMLRSGEGRGGGGEGEGAGGGGSGEASQRAWEEELRPSKVRSMLASRACRSSIMVGRPLRHPEMSRLLAGLADLRQPWNCPHGRPTMRHVCVLPEQGRAGMAPA